MKIGILGAGLMGGKLGALWSKEGHSVCFSYARNETKLARLANSANASFGTVAEAVAGADAVLLAVHWLRINDVLSQAGDLTGMPVLNCCVPLNDANTELVVGMTTSGAEELAKLRPNARWVSCFNTTPSESFYPVFDRKGQGTPPNVMVCGDDEGAKEIAGDLIRDIGFEPADTGPLRNARFVEPFAMATVEFAYVQPGGAAWTYRFEKLRD